MNELVEQALLLTRWTSCLIGDEASAAEAVPESWLQQARELAFLFNADKRYHEEFQGFDQRYENGDDVIRRDDATTFFLPVAKI